MDTVEEIKRVANVYRLDVPELFEVVRKENGQYFSVHGISYRLLDGSRSAQWIYTMDKEQWNHRLPDDKKWLV